MYKKKRIGRGNGTKKGNTCGRGNKGQKSRSGYSKKRFFLGGQTRINIKNPKLGFKGKKKNIKKISSIKKNKNNFFNKKEKIIVFKSNLSKKFSKKIEMFGGNVIK